MALKIWHSKMYNILKMVDRRAKRMKIWGLAVLCTVLCRVLFMSDSFESVEIIRCTLQNS